MKKIVLCSLLVSAAFTKCSSNVLELLQRLNAANITNDESKDDSFTPEAYEKKSELLKSQIKDQEAILAKLHKKQNELKHEEKLIKEIYTLFKQHDLATDDYAQMLKDDYLKMAATLIHELETGIEPDVRINHRVHEANAFRHYDFPLHTPYAPTICNTLKETFERVCTTSEKRKYLYNKYLAADSAT